MLPATRARVSLYRVPQAVLRWRARPCRAGAAQPLLRSAPKGFPPSVRRFVQVAESRASEGVMPKRRRNALLK